MSSLKRFFITYFRILKLAYQVHPGLLALLTVANAAWGLSNLPVLYINKALIDVVIASVNNPNWQAALKIVILLISVRTLIEAVRVVLSRIQTHVSNSFGSLMSDRISLILGQKLNTLDIPTIESADFQDKFSKIETQSHQRIWGMLASLSDFPNAVTTIISGVVPLVQFNPLIILGIIAVGIPDAIVNAKLAKLDFISQGKRSRLYRSLGRLHWLLTSTSMAIENKLLKNIDYILDKTRNLQDDIYHEDATRRTRRAKWRTLADIPGWLFSATLNIYFFFLAIIGRISLGTAQLLYQSSQTFSNGVGTLMNNMSVVYEHYLFVSDYTWFMELQSAHARGTILFPQTLQEGIKFDHVWFKYPNAADWTLQDVSFTLGPKDNVALVGENGAGKTTLLKLLLGLYRPNQGTITIDGIDITSLDPQSYLDQTSALSQDFMLFPFSARESIAYSDLSRVNNLEEVKTAAQHARIDDYLSSLPRGYDTPIVKDLDGVDPSGGQRQRIAIARTLFKKSQLMVLDEPTSNVDPKAEEEIFDNVLSVTKDQIVILVSHRFSTVRQADRILVLDHGSLIEQGSHTQLMKKKGHYAKLFTIQAKSYQ